MKSGEDFAFETTLATRSYVGLIERAKEAGYDVHLLFLWLNSPELALQRVKTRVAEGGHNIPEDVIKRRYQNGLKNFFNLYQSVVTDWYFYDNTGKPYHKIAEGGPKSEVVQNKYLWEKLKDIYNE